MSPLDLANHRCPWRESFEALEAKVFKLGESFEKLQGEVASLKTENAELKEQLKAKGARSTRFKSERRPQTKNKPRKQLSEQERAAALEKRRARRQAQRELESKTIEHRVADSERVCEACGKQRRPFGEGRVTEIIERVAACLVRELHRQETLSCGCGEPPVQAPAPSKPVFGGRYGPGLLAYLCVSKCADSLPIHRLVKSLKREGLELSKSTLNDLLHKASSLLSPFAKKIKELIVSSRIVASDDTEIKIQKLGSSKSGGCFRGYVFNFNSLDPKLVLYVCRLTKDRFQALGILGESEGYLISDGTGSYVAVTKNGHRISCGCWAHTRRYFLEAEQEAPDLAAKALDLIGQIYAVDDKARELGIEGSEAHTQLRQRECPKILDSLKRFLDAQQPKHAPKSKAAKAIGYAINQWQALGRFVEDARIPLDNNLSERMLRQIGIGRKNWMFVGDEQKGESLMVIYSLVKSCELNDVNPLEYLTSVFSNLDKIRESNLEEWLPHLWKPPPKNPEAESAN